MFHCQLTGQSDESSPNDTPYIDVANYDHSNTNTSITLMQLTTEFLPTTTTSNNIYLLFVTDAIYNFYTEVATIVANRQR